MSILNSKPHKAALQVLNNVEMANSIMREAHFSAMAALWNNPDATPQEILAELGPKAAEVFQLSAALVQFLMTIDPTFVPQVPPLPFTIHEDGTVTIDEDPPPP